MLIGFSSNRDATVAIFVNHDLKVSVDVYACPF